MLEQFVQLNGTCFIIIVIMISYSNINL